MKFLVTGGSGQLGSDVESVLRQRGLDYLSVGTRQLDITDEDAVFACMRAYRPDAVLHCAAYTKVDQAEEEEERCRMINAAGTRHIARACEACGAKLLYTSTDYVFPGTGETPYETDALTGPLNVYGQTKLEGEFAVREALERHFIVRVSWLFGKNGNNFVKTMLRLGRERRTLNVVCDQIGSPTYTADLAVLLCDMVESDVYGTYHATNEGFCSWYDCAKAVFRLSGETTEVLPIATADYPTKAKRPLNSRLSKKSLMEAGFSRLPAWEDGLLRYVMAEDYLAAPL